MFKNICKFGKNLKKCNQKNMNWLNMKERRLFGWPKPKLFQG